MVAMKYTVALLLGVVLLGILAKASSAGNNLEEKKNSNEIHREKRTPLCNANCQINGKLGGVCRDVHRWYYDTFHACPVGQQCTCF